MGLESAQAYVLPKRAGHRSQQMIKYRDGEWYVFQEKTTKPFERFRIDASRGLMIGLQAFFATHEWRADHATYPV